MRGWGKTDPSRLIGCRIDLTGIVLAGAIVSGLGATNLAKGLLGRQLVTAQDRAQSMIYITGNSTLPWPI